MTVETKQVRPDEEQPENVPICLILFLHLQILAPFTYFRECFPLSPDATYLFDNVRQKCKNSLVLKNTTYVNRILLAVSLFWHNSSCIRPTCRGLVLAAKQTGVLLVRYNGVQYWCKACYCDILFYTKASFIGFAKIDCSVLFAAYRHVGTIATGAKNMK